MTRYTLKKFADDLYDFGLLNAVAFLLVIIIVFAMVWIVPTLAPIGAISKP